MRCRVVNVRKSRFDVYIGKSVKGKFAKSDFANPFKIGVHGTREECIGKYRLWLLSHPEILRRARKELKGKVLGCWCKPKACHGDVLVELVNNPKAKIIQPKVMKSAARDEPSLLIHIMAGTAKGRWWHIWGLGRPNPLNLDRRPKYYLGVVKGKRSLAVKRARKCYPDWTGNMELELIEKRKSQQSQG